MRLASFVLLLVLTVAACSEPDTRVYPAQVSWMEWPAEVPADAPFEVRLVGYGVYCVEVVKFVTAPTVNESAVTFEPYFLLHGQPNNCLPIQAATTGDPTSFVPILASFDTGAAVPGLEAEVPRTYEIRAGTSVSASGVAAAFPIRTFGEVTVRSAGVVTERLNAGGHAAASRDSLGCVRLSAYGLPAPYVIENAPADTARTWRRFVRGYIYEPAAPVCGQARVFHLVTLN
jgi:hypothetical protein